MGTGRRKRNQKNYVPDTKEYTAERREIRLLEKRESHERKIQQSQVQRAQLKMQHLARIDAIINSKTYKAMDMKQEIAEDEERRLVRKLHSHVLKDNLQTQNFGIIPENGLAFLYWAGFEDAKMARWKPS